MSLSVRGVSLSMKRIAFLSASRSTIFCRAVLNCKTTAVVKLCSVSDRVKKIHTNIKVQKILRPDHGPQISVDYLCKQMWSLRGVRG